MALVCLPLLREPERWIYRRVERISFKDYETARHQVSADFTLPPETPAVSIFDRREVYVAPLFLLLKSPMEPMREGRRSRKRFFLLGERRPSRSEAAIPTPSISDLDFENQLGERQALLTRRQSRLLATVMLLEAAQEIVQEPITGDLRRHLSAIANRDRAELHEALTYLFRQRLRCCHRDPRRRLRADPHFVELVYMLASHSLIACLFTDRPARRTILKLSYDEPVNEYADRGNWRPLRALGWRSERFSVLLNEIGAASSYHVEIEVPPELSVNAVGLIGARYRHFGQDLRKLSDNDKDYFIQQIDRANAGNIYVPAPLPGRRFGQTWVKLRNRRPGFLIGALLASCITTILLALASSAAPEIVADEKSEAAVVTLLLVPTLLAAYVVRPGEHPITAHMLRWTRFALVGDAALLFLAAFFLFMAKDGPVVTEPVVANIMGFKLTLLTKGDHPGEWLQGWWQVLTWISLAGVVMFTLSNILPLPHGKTVYKPLPREE